MTISEELMLGIERYSPWNFRDFVAKSQDMMNVLIYLRAAGSLR